MKAGRKKSINSDTIKKIADYFGVDTDRVIFGKPQKEAALTEAEADDEMYQILHEFRENPELRTLFSLSKKATPEELKQYISVIKALRGGN